jgi:hypothetical protein
MILDISELEWIKELNGNISSFRKKPLPPILLHVFRENITITKRQKRNKISKGNADRDFWITLDCNSGKTLKEIGKKYKLCTSSIRGILWRQIRMAKHPNRWPEEEYAEYVRRKRTHKLLES